MKTLWLLLLIAASLAAQSWVPTFEDDFNGAELDLARWISHDPQSAAQLSPAAVKVNGGELHIGASGVVSTFGIFAQMYGRFEIRLRVCTGAEMFLAPVPYGILPRIDIFRTTAPERLFFANHWGNEQTERSYSDSFAVPDLSKGFHTMAVEWERDHITWFVDGKKTFESRDGVPQQPMYLVIDLAARGARGDASFDVDYVRVYKHPEQ